MKIAITVFLVLIIGCAVRAAPAVKKRGCKDRKATGINFRIRKDNVIDLTYVTNDKAAHWPDFPTGFQVTELSNGFTEDIPSYFVAYNKFNQPEHLGTHMDAPVHFAQGRKTVDEVSLDTLIGFGVLLDLTTDGERFNESFITIDHFLEWERRNGQIRSDDIILMRTGLGDHYLDRSQYYGTSITGPASIPHLQFPGLHQDTAQWLIEERCIAAIGIDSMSIDEGQSKEFLAHQVLSRANIPIFENVANLDKLAKRNTKFKVIALPYNMEKATGAPVRIIAITR